VVLGVWLAVAAFALAGPGSAARFSDVAVGAALVIVSLAARPGSTDGFAAIVLGTWLMVAPTALGYPDPVNAAVDVVTGFAVVAAALHPHLGRRLGGRRALRA
jgi:hypothetical protein